MQRNTLALVLIGLLSSLAIAEDLTVAAAADLNFALRDLAERFEKQSGNKVRLSFGSSGNLFSQVQAGAPFDLFFSADVDYPQKLAASRLVDPDSVSTYAIGHLVLWVPSNSNLDPQKLKINLLTEPEVRKIAIANPQHAPYGRAAMAALQHFGLEKKLAAKLVFGENISQTAQFVQSGNAQAGLIALSLAVSPTMKNTGKFWVLPSDSYPELKQAVAIISASKHQQAAKAFLDYVLSQEGRRVLDQYGFGAPVGP